MGRGFRGQSTVPRYGERRVVRRCHPPRGHRRERRRAQIHLRRQAALWTALTISRPCDERCTALEPRAFALHVPSYYMVDSGVVPFRASWTGYFFAGDLSGGGGAIRRTGTTGAAAPRGHATDSGGACSCGARGRSSNIG